MFQFSTSPIFNIAMLSLIASLGTGLGGLLALIHKPGRRSFGFLMGFTAGVMITLALMELVAEAWHMAGYLTATAGFALGALFMFFLDYFAPHIRFGEKEIRTEGSPLADGDCGEGNPAIEEQTGRHGGHQHKHGRQNVITDPKLLRTGFLLAIGITIHNLPEGIAVGAGYLKEPAFGVFIAIAILLHNIPEGIATALPLYKCGMGRFDCIKIAFFSGLTEPIGALLAASLLSSFMWLLPGALAFAGGVMLFITLDELLPAAREHGHQHYTALGIILGAIAMFLLSGFFGV